MTARDLISSSARLIGVLASGAVLSSDEATDGLASLNAMLDGWSAEGLLVPSVVREVFPLVVSQATYTMGPSGNFNTTRPTAIESALLQVTSGTSVLEWDLRILSPGEYAAIGQKTMESTYPASLYPDNAYPLLNLTLYPVPSAANYLVLYSRKPLGGLSNLSAAISLPPGYERAIRYNLAVEMAPEYGRPIDPAVGVIAVDSKATLERQNTQPQYLSCDAMPFARSGGFDMFTGSPGGGSEPYDEGTF